MTPTQQPSPVAADERTRFEHEYCGNGRLLVRRNSTTGDYVNPSIDDAWHGWQARAARASASPQAPVAGMEVRRGVGRSENGGCEVFVYDRQTLKMKPGTYMLYLGPPDTAAVDAAIAKCQATCVHTVHEQITMASQSERIAAAFAKLKIALTNGSSR